RTAGTDNTGGIGGSRGHPRHGDALRIGAWRITRIVGGVGYCAPVLEPTGIQVFAGAEYFIDFPGLDRADDVQAITELAASRYREVPVLAVTLELVEAGADRHLQALELAIDNKVGNTAE